MRFARSQKRKLSSSVRRRGVSLAAPATVKRHTENVYDKLGVHGRRKAVAKASGLTLLGDRLRPGAYTAQPIYALNT